MRKYIMLFIALCLHGLARGQTEGYTGFYWFDYQQGKPQTSPVIQGSFDADVSALADGIHTFHYLVAKEGGAISMPVYTYFLKTTSTTSTEQITCLCTIDGELVHHELLPAKGGAIHWSLNVSDIADGLHQVQIDALAADGAMTCSQHSFFVKVPKADTAIRGYYWFDEETDAREAPITHGTFEVDASSLSDGFHQFHYYVLQANGVSSLPSANYFLKTAQVNPDDELTCICTVDDQLRHIEKLSQQGGIIHWDLDMQDLADGVHKIQFQAVTPSGAVSTSYTSYFMRVTSYEDLNEMYCVYSIDGNTLNKRSQVMPNNGCFHFDLDLSELEEGLHYISFMLHSDRGASTNAQTQFFVKTPLGGNGITQYQYWLNDDDINQSTIVTLPEKSNPLQLMSLLPVESRPLRSSLFHFDVSSGKPMIYAKNTIHLRFHDVAKRFTDIAKDYVDYSVGQEVNVIKTLVSGVRETTDRPEEDQIKWYKVTAERGDSLSFKYDRAATLQVFSPSGQEVHNVHGSESVTWNGLNAEESGTFYVALHDVTATQGEVINLDYEHIDRYAVLRQDVDVVGNAGCSTITFDGNGYDELTSVELIQGSYIIPSVEIGHESKATTSVKFDFSGATLGEYKAVFHFTEGELTREKCITVEEAKEPNLEIDVSYASQFLQGTSNKFYFKVHNRGNMTAYGVPLGIYICSPDSTSLTKVFVDGYNLNKDFREYLGENYTEALAKQMAQKESDSGDLCYLNKYRETSIVSGLPYLYWQCIVPDIRPYTTETFVIDVKTTQKVYVGLFLQAETNNEESNNVASIKKSKRYDDPCAKPRIGRLEGGNQEIWNSSFNCCPGCGGGGGGGTGTPVTSLDPNDIYGYLSEAGSKFIADSVARVNYTIEFENDTTFATAAAHTIVIKDTLDSRYFDLTKFMPTGVRIGGRETFLDEADVVTNNNKTSFVKTIDMRPEINAIAQVEGEFNQKNGIAEWRFTSLDPMTMEPTDDLMQGILPVNHDGTSGIGEVMFEVGVKSGKADGTKIDNRAGIVFDYEEAILTPTWTNIVDAVAPSSIVDGLTMLNDSTLRVHADASDARSGVWKYEWYVQHGENAPWWKEGETYDDCFDFHFYEGFDYGFCVVVTDSAGNVERKELARERIFKSYGQDFEDRVEGVNGQSSMVNGQSIYDLSGRRLTVPRRGVNIIDDKKVMKK